jgi:hypothetical protein
VPTAAASAQVALSFRVVLPAPLAGGGSAQDSLNGFQAGVAAALQQSLGVGPAQIQRLTVTAAEAVTRALTVGLGSPMLGLEGAREE